MKITEINSDELQINDKGLGQFIGGLVFAIIGVAIGVWGSISQTSSNLWMTVGFGAVFVLIGIITSSMAASRQIILRRAGASEVITKKLITKKTTSVTFTTDQIASVNFETHTEYDQTKDSDGNTRETEQRVSTVRVVLKDTTEIMLASSRGGNGLTINGVDLSGLGRAPLYDEATRIASFYNVPLQTNMRTQDPIAAIGQIVSTVKQGISAASTQPSVVAQPLQPAVPTATQSQPTPVVASLPVQSFAQAASPAVTEVTTAQPVMPVASVVPASTSQPAQGDNLPQVPPRN